MMELCLNVVDPVRKAKRAAERLAKMVPMVACAPTVTHKVQMGTRTDIRFEQSSYNSTEVIVLKPNAIVKASALK